jgi:hypothetical protein
MRVTSTTADCLAGLPNWLPTCHRIAIVLGTQRVTAASILRHAVGHMQPAGCLPLHPLISAIVPAGHRGRSMPRHLPRRGQVDAEVEQVPDASPAQVVRSGGRDPGLETALPADPPRPPGLKRASCRPAGKARQTSNHPEQAAAVPTRETRRIARAAGLLPDPAWDSG